MDGRVSESISASDGCFRLRHAIAPLRRAREKVSSLREDSAEYALPEVVRLLLRRPDSLREDGEMT